VSAARLHCAAVTSFYFVSTALQLRASLSGENRASLAQRREPGQPRSATRTGPASLGDEYRVDSFNDEYRVDSFNDEYRVDPFNDEYRCSTALLLRYERGPRRPRGRLVTGRALGDCQT
jgi:hypothetical protein